LRQRNGQKKLGSTKESRQRKPPLQEKAVLYLAPRFLVW
jgi:hypothetical protein